MASSWFVYGTASRAAAVAAVEKMYAKLAGIVGEDLAEHLEPGEELEPPKLGYWPDVKVVSTPVPDAFDQRKSLTRPGKSSVRFEEAALTRLESCVSVVRLERQQGFDPALVTAMRALLEALGPAVFTQGQGFDLITSETMLSDIAEDLDLPTALRAVAAGEDDDEDEDDEDEDEDEEDEDEDEDEEDEEDEEANEEARPEMLRGTLAAMAGLPRVRRKVSELMANAPDLVGRFTERLARVGAEPDAVAAKELGVTEKDVVGARKALALILRRAEGR